MYLLRLHDEQNEAGGVAVNTNFYSMDKLVEFGMSVAVAGQMMSAMNQSLNQMQMPGAGKAMPVNPDNFYYAVIDGSQSGPYSLAEMSRLIAEKKIVKETYIWKPGMSQWELAENVGEVLRLVAITPPPVHSSC